MRRTTELLRALAAAAALAALLVGLPAFLALAVGWPLPRAVPSLAEIAETISGDRHLETVTVWKILAAVLWLAWLQLLAAAATEARAAMSGGLPRAVPGLHLAHGLVAPLVAALVIAWPTSTGARAAAAAPPAPVVNEHVAEEAAEVVDLREAPPAPAPSTETTLEHVVQRRDTLWDLAERYLGDGFRSTELFELNKGRPQPDGETLTDPGLLRPGWVLRIPTPAQPTEIATTSVLVEPDDSLWELAEEYLGDGHRYREVFDLNEGRTQPDGDALERPELIRPGWRLDLPGVERAPVAATAAAPAPPAPTMPVQPPATAPSTTSTTGVTTTVADVGSETVGRTGGAEAPAAVAEDPQRRPVGVLGIAGGFLAAGISAAVAVGRRRQRARRRPGTELPPVPGAAAPVLDAIADLDVDLAERVDHALRQLGSLLRDRSNVPVPAVVSVHDGRIELLLDRVDREPPAPWESDGDGRIWRAAVAQVADGDRSGPAWVPALVSVGALEEGGVLLNLEATAAATVGGEARAAASLVRSFAAELSVTPLSDVPAVFVVGDVVGALTLPNVRRFEVVSEALDAALQHVAPIAPALVGTGCDSVVALRCRAPEEAWSPAVVVAAAEALSDEEARRLVDLAHERVGVAVVLLGEVSGAFRLDVADATVSLADLDLTCDVQLLEAPAVEQIVDLVESTDDDCVEPEPDAPLTLFEPSRYGIDGSGERATVHVRMLGPIAVEGVELKPQHLAIVAFLALHGEVTGDALRDAIWGGSTPTRERFQNTISELRRALGNDALPAMTDGRYRLCNVWCDLAEIERLLKPGDARDRAENLRAALELVTGPPITFDSRHRRHFRWVDNGNHASRWDRLVGDAAHELVGIALKDDDADLARWAAERGLLASPGNETLTRDLLAAHMAAGDRSTAEKVADEYARAMEDLGYDDVPDLLEEALEDRRVS